MNEREALLGRIRDAIGAGTGRAASVAARLSKPPVGVIPARAEGEAQALILRFCQMAEKAHASVERLEAPKDIPAAVAGFLRRHNLPQAVRRGSDPRLADLPWGQEKQLSLSVGASDGSDLAGLSHAETGAAETGTLVLLSGTDNPTTLNFLPENHIVVVDAATIVGSYEATFDRVRARFGTKLPRTVNMITGPSRSSDIEQTLQFGAHGPLRLHILIVGRK